MRHEVELIGGPRDGERVILPEFAEILHFFEPLKAKWGYSTNSVNYAAYTYRYTGDKRTYQYEGATK